MGQKQSIHCNVVYIKDHNTAVLFFFRHCGYIKAKQDPDEEKMQFQHGRGKNNSCTHKQTCLFLLQMVLFQFFTDFFFSVTLQHDTHKFVFVFVWAQGFLHMFMLHNHWQWIPSLPAFMAINETKNSLNKSGVLSPGAKAHQSDNTLLYFVCIPSNVSK